MSEYESSDRDEIYNRRDRKKKRRDWREKRRQDSRKREQQRPANDYVTDDDWTDDQPT